MLKDPIEETEEFKAVIDEVERKVYLHFIDIEVRALEDIVYNGFTNIKDAAFGIYRVDVIKKYASNIPTPEVAKEREEEAARYLKEIQDHLEKDEIYEAYMICCRIRGSFYGHMYWCKKKCVLREEYGIIWKTPEEMNPWILF